MVTRLLAEAAVPTGYRARRLRAQAGWPRPSAGSPWATDAGRQATRPADRHSRRPQRRRWCPRRRWPGPRVCSRIQALICRIRSFGRRSRCCRERSCRRRREYRHARPGRAIVRSCQDVLDGSALIDVVDARDDDDRRRRQVDNVANDPRRDLVAPLAVDAAVEHVPFGLALISQYAYWLVSSPCPLGGASSADRNPGVPAVVESPSATMRMRKFGDRGRAARSRWGAKLTMSTKASKVKRFFVIIVSFARIVMAPS